VGGYGMNEDLVSLHRTLYELRNPTRRWLNRTRKEWISNARGNLCEAIPPGMTKRTYSPAGIRRVRLMTAHRVSAS